MAFFKFDDYTLMDYKSFVLASIDSTWRYCRIWTPSWQVLDSKVGRRKTNSRNNGSLLWRGVTIQIFKLINFRPLENTSEPDMDKLEVDELHNPTLIPLEPIEDHIELSSDTTDSEIEIINGISSTHKDEAKVKGKLASSHFNGVNIWLF